MEPKHDWLDVLKETIRDKHIRCFSKLEKEICLARCAWSGSHTSLVVEESTMDEKFNKSKIVIPQIPKTRAQRGAVKLEDLIKNSLKGRFQENSESEKQSVISAQEPPTTHRSEMSQETKACDSWRKRSDKTYKEVVEQSTKSIAGGSSF